MEAFEIIPGTIDDLCSCLSSACHLQLKLRLHESSDLVLFRAVFLTLEKYVGHSRCSMNTCRKDKWMME